MKAIGGIGQVLRSVLMFPVAVAFTVLYVIGLVFEAVGEGWRRTGY